MNMGPGAGAAAAAAPVESTLRCLDLNWMPLEIPVAYAP